MNIFRRILNFLLEFPCPLCGRDSDLPHDFNSFCVDCLNKLPFIHGKRCPGCGGELSGVYEQCAKCLAMPPRPWKHAMSLFKMDGYAEQAIYNLKFRGGVVIARSIAELAAPLLQTPEFNDADVIVPVPLHWQRRWQRGYNQSEMLARMLAQKLHKPCCCDLKRIKPTQRQATLKREDRLKNLNGAFNVPRPAKLAGRKVLLVDDVLTTGATLHAAAEALLQAGVREVAIFTAARR